jgi:hypothetical protein
LIEETGGEAVDFAPSAGERAAAEAFLREQVSAELPEVSYSGG